MTDDVEPDYRFTLANERTMLSWVRTALSLLAAAVAVVKLVPPFAVPEGREAAAVLLAAAGLVAAVLGPYRYLRVQRAMRRNRPLPATGALLLVPAVVALVGVLVLAAAIVGDGVP